MRNEAYKKKVDRAVKLIRSSVGDDVVGVSYSGGKDSDVILELVKMAVRLFHSCLMARRKTKRIGEEIFLSLPITFLYNYENKHYVRTSLAKGEQTFTRQDDVLRKPATKG